MDLGASVHVLCKNERWALCNRRWLRIEEESLRGEKLIILLEDKVNEIVDNFC